MTKPSKERMEAYEAEERAEVAENMRKFGYPYDPYFDSCHRIDYLGGKYGKAGWKAFLKRLDTESVGR